MGITTGYFANWRVSGTRRSKVHAVHNGSPICGSVIGDDSEYLWCSSVLRMEYIECEKCKKILENKIVCPYCSGIFDPPHTEECE